MKMSIFKIITTIAILLTITACGMEDKEIEDQDTVFTVYPESRICEGIVTEVEEYIEDHMAHILADLIPNSTASDQLGHEENLNTVIERLNVWDCLEVELLCYACIETLPLISELRIKADFEGDTVNQIMDIATPDDGLMVYLSMHQ